MMIKTEKGIIPALTGIRAICVYLIFFKHHNPFDPEKQQFAWLLTHQCFSFLSFFFVLSGFLICLRYHAVGSLRRTDLRNYFVNRISRVFPILILLITATFLLQYRANPGDETLLKTWLYNISLLKGFSSEYYLTGIGPSWSMSVEELFYLLSPLIFFMVRKPVHLLWLTLTLYAAGIIITCIFLQWPADGFFSDFHFTFYTTFFGRAFEFACGIFLAMVVREKFSARIFKKIKTLPAGLILLACSILAQYFIALHYGVVNAVETRAGVVVNNIMIPIAITLIFYSLVYEKSLLQKLLATPLMVALGNATYSFYLLHTSFVMSWILSYISGSLWIAFPAMIITAYIFYRVVEQPLASVLRRKFTI